MYRIGCNLSYLIWYSNILPQTSEWVFIIPSLQVSSWNCFVGRPLATLITSLWQGLDKVREQEPEDIQIQRELMRVCKRVGTSSSSCEVSAMVKNLVHSMVFKSILHDVARCGHISCNRNTNDYLVKSTKKWKDLTWLS